MRSAPRRRVLCWLVALLPVAAEPSAAQLAIGLDFTACTLAECGGIPPDTVGAVGPDHIVHFTNGQYRVFRKSDGFLLVTMSDFDFWTGAGVLSFDTFDPRVLYDPSTQRWFATMASNRRSAASGYVIAVSDTADPTDDWTAFAVDGDPRDLTWLDFPMMGLDADGVYLTANMFTISNDVWTANSVLVLPKADLVAASPSIANATLFDNLPPSALGFKPQPAVNLDGAGLPASITGFVLTPFAIFARIAGPVVQPTLINTGVDGFTPVPILGEEAFPPNARQPFGPPLEVDAEPSQNWVMRNGRLWGVRVASKDDHPALQWFQVDPATRSILQTGLIADPDLDFFYPSIAVNELEQVVIGFSGSGPIRFASSYAVLGLTERGVTTFGQPVLLKEGEGPWILTQPPGRNRWGDYSATVMDPSDPGVFWTFQQWAGSSNDFATQATQLVVLDGPTGIEVSKTAALVDDTVSGTIRITNVGEHRGAITILDTLEAKFRKGTVPPLPEGSTPGWYRIADVPVQGRAVIEAGETLEIGYAFDLCRGENSTGARSIRNVVSVTLINKPEKARKDTVVTRSEGFEPSFECLAVVENFESGSLGGQWTTSSSTPQGRIQVTGAFGTATGDFALLMDRSPSGADNRNEAVWTVDLSGFARATLEFFHADFNDEETLLPADFVASAPGDGVAISDDGTNWHTVLNATALPFGQWNRVEIDLGAEAASAGMLLGPDFRIKFQQDDNFPLTTDGRGYDDIRIWGPSPGP